MIISSIVLLYKSVLQLIENRHHPNNLALEVMEVVTFLLQRLSFQLVLQEFSVLEDWQILDVLEFCISFTIDQFMYIFVVMYFQIQLHSYFLVLIFFDHHDSEFLPATQVFIGYRFIRYSYL